MKSVNYVALFGICLLAPTAYCMEEKPKIAAQGEVQLPTKKYPFYYDQYGTPTTSIITQRGTGKGSTLEINPIDRNTLYALLHSADGRLAKTVQHGDEYSGFSAQYRLTLPANDATRGQIREYYDNLELEFSKKPEYEATHEQDLLEKGTLARSASGTITHGPASDYTNEEKTDYVNQGNTGKQKEKSKWKFWKK